MQEEKFVNAGDIIDIVYAYCKKYKISLSHYAKLSGISKAWLSRLNHENNKVSLYVAQRLLATAGYYIQINHKNNTQKISKYKRLKKVIANEKADR